MPLRSRRPILATLTALVLSGSWVAFSTTFTLQRGDFLALYTGAVIALHGDIATLHDAQLQAKLQATVVTRPDPVYFVRPQIYAAFLAPLALLPIRQAFAVFILLCSAVLIAIWYWAYYRFGSDAVALLALFPVSIMSFAFGQDAVLFLGLFVLSYSLFERGRPTLSGCILGLVFIKPHLMLLMPFALILQRRWRMLGGMVFAASMEALISLALGGFAGAWNYLRFIQQQQHWLSPTPERMMNVYAIGLNLGLDGGVAGKMINATLVLLTLICVGVICWRGQWWQAFGAAVVGTFLIAPHTYLYDSTLVLLPAILAAFLASALLARAVAILFCTPVLCLLQLLDKPWPVGPALALLLLLIGLTLDRLAVYKTSREALSTPLPVPI